MVMNCKENGAVAARPEKEETTAWGKMDDYQGKGYISGRSAVADHTGFVHIEYWYVWQQLGQLFTELKVLVLTKMPNLQIAGSYGAKGSFEVSYNGDIIFSKLETNTLPDLEALVEEVWQRSNTVDDYTTKKTKFCTLL